jgi:hypothetical protein
MTSPADLVVGLITLDRLSEANVIKDISKENISYDFGHLSISVDELIKIIEEKGGTNVTAKNKSTEFESLDDIKAHKSLFTGEPKLYLNEATISFERHWHRVSPSHRQTADIAFTKSMFEELIRRKSFIDKFSELKIFQLRYLIPLFAISTIIKYTKTFTGLDQNIILVWDILYNVYLALIIIKFLWDGYSHFFREAVYHRPAQGFFRRNFDTVAVSAITGVLGLVIGTFGPSLIEKIGKWF